MSRLDSWGGGAFTDICAACCIRAGAMRNLKSVNAEPLLRCALPCLSFKQACHLQLRGMPPATWLLPMSTRPLLCLTACSYAHLQTKHVKPTAQGEQGQIVKKEFPVHHSNVAVYSTAQQVASRVGLK